MDIPKPIPGLVIRYSYLWHWEYLKGRDEGQKDRPCAIIAGYRKDESGNLRVVVLPITHTAPSALMPALEIPKKVKQMLKLDNDRSWVILTEWNEFNWPGPDVRRLPNKGNDSIAYGVLPPDLFYEIAQAFKTSVIAKRAKPVPRS